MFTRLMLALFGIISWRAVPLMPVEIMLLPKWFPFHLDKISYWSRTVIVPLLVLQALKPRARNDKRVTIEELFLEPPQTIAAAPKAPQQKATWFWFFRGVDIVLRMATPLSPAGWRKAAIDRAVAWVTERLNGEDGLGAIFPAMANSVMMFDALGYPESDPNRAIARGSIEKLLAVHGHEAYCQPCVSPVWDTALTCHAMLEAGGDRARAQSGAACNGWCRGRFSMSAGDWSARRPDLRPGGWAFQYANPHYPDVDDTAVAVMAMDRLRLPSFAPPWRPRTNGSSACKAVTAAGARSMPTTSTTISTTFHSPTTAPCSIPLPRMSPRAVCPCWRSSARRRRAARRSGAPSIICAARSCPMGAGTAVGA